ncbi:hypothetical protein [Oleiharenicola sp. Vm1]|uniref:hypothetical protein n=1 Tax=Oleiharenicola sp. Vm1 TaxID=3398393 RepID=UPI0039F5F7B3
METPTLFERISDWLLNQWPFVILALVVTALGFVPTIRDGAITLWQLIPRKKKALPTDPLTVLGEEVRFEVLLHSRDFDVVKVLTQSHPAGVAAEHAWLEKQYPEWKFRTQGLTSLEYLSGKTGKRPSFFKSSVFFDRVVIHHEDGRSKEVFFDISEFFTQVGTSLTNPREFIAHKVGKLYRKK